jgi:AmmeMemoRadiSam system protein A
MTQDQASDPAFAEEMRARGEALVRWARARLMQELGGPAATAPTGAWCNEPGATFVTLHWTGGELQGCIGSLEPHRSIVSDVAQNTIASALFDPRAAPLKLEDVSKIDFELSILSPLEPIEFSDETSAIAALRQGTDGVVLEWHGHRGTFLPSMWPILGDARNFMRELKRKAGLTRDFWDAGVKLKRYTVQKFVDRGQ